MIVAPRCLIRNASASSAVMKSPAMNSPLPSMKKQRSASPSQAMPMSARLGHHPLDDVAAVLLDERDWPRGSGTCRRSRSTAGWSGRAAGRRAAARPAPPMPLPASSTTLNGLISGRVDERQHVLDVVVDHVGRSTVPRAARTAAGMVPPTIMSRMSEMPASPLSGNASRPHHLHAVVLLRVVRGGDLRRRRRARRGRRRSTSCRCRACRSRRRRRPARAPRR